MDTTTGLLLLALFLCVAFSGFFSASETAFMSANRIKLRTHQQNGDPRAELALSLQDNGDRLLTAILVGNNLVNIAGTAIATVLFTRWLGEGTGPTVSTAAMTLLILLFGEVTPKMLAKQSAERFCLRSARPLRVLMAVLLPVDKLFSLWRKMIHGLFKPREDDTPIEDELKTMVDEAQQEGDMDAHEGELIRSAIEFVDQDALDIMTPRVDVIAVEDTDTPEEAERLFMESGYSRLPVYHGDMDHMVGVLNLKDFHAAREKGVTDLRQIMMPAVYAPATLKISKLLRLCQTTKTHLVVVLDEFGGTEGIVSIEDVLEELVGEIYDENDDVSEDMVTLDDGSWQVDGGMPLTAFLENLNIEDTYDSDTVGGWAAEVLGRIPAVGDSFEAAGLHGVVTAMDRLRVTRLHFSAAGREPAGVEEAQTD